MHNVNLNNNSWRVLFIVGYVFLIVRIKKYLRMNILIITCYYERENIFTILIM